MGNKTTVSKPVDEKQDSEVVVQKIPKTKVTFVGDAMVGKSAQILYL